VLRSLDGVKEVEVSLDPGEAKVSFDPANTTLDQIRGAIADAGYTTD
jgi:copper chaperone CopZ